MKDIKLLLSSFLIICAFFMGYLFAEQKNKLGESLETESIYVNVQKKGKNITIDSENPNIILLLNGQETSSGSIVLE